MSTRPAHNGAPPSGHDDAGPALFRLVRFWSRRWIARTSEHLTGQQRHVQHIMAVEAVDTADTGASDITVGTVAHHLGLDHSGASRIVRDATAAGYLTRAESGHDRRRAALHLTGPGRELLAGSHDWQRQAFDALTADWSPADRHQFAGYLLRLADQVTTSDASE